MSDDDPTTKLPSKDSAEALHELTNPLYALQKRLQQFEEQVATINRIEEQVAALDQKLDKRLQDTRPIWEGVLAEVRDLRITTEKEIRGLKGKVELLSRDNFEMRSAVLELQKRVESLDAGR